MTAANQIPSNTIPSGAHPGIFVVGHLTTLTYTLRLRFARAADFRDRPDGKTTSYTYDDADRLTSVTDAAANVTHHAYDTESNLLNLTHAAGRSTFFTYDAFGRVTQTNFPSTLSENYCGSPECKTAAS